MFDTAPYETRMQQAISHFEDEIKKVRTGRAHPSMLEGVMVEVYGTKMPLNQVASIAVPEPQLLQITPFDQANVMAVASAIRDDQSLGFNPTDDGRIVRVPIPALNEERRRQIVKQLGDKVEETRISLRNIRHDALRDAKKAKEDKQIADDDMKRVEKALDKLMGDMQVKLDSASKAKEQEIMTI